MSLVETGERGARRIVATGRPMAANWDAALRFLESIAVAVCSPVFDEAGDAIANRPKKAITERARSFVEAIDADTIARIEVRPRRRIRGAYEILSDYGRDDIAQIVDGGGYWVGTYIGDMGTQEAEEASADAVRFSRREPGLGNRRDALWAATLLALDSRGTITITLEDGTERFSVP